MHIGIIMDGNRRWSEKNTCSVLQAYKTGASVAGNICRYIFSNDIASYLTLWGLSQENRKKRTKEEVENILSCFHNQLLNEKRHILDNNICFKIIGDKTCFSSDIVRDINTLEEMTMQNEKKLYIAMNYSGREEIIYGLNNYLHQQGNNQINQLSADKLTDFLYDKNMPNLDIVIRTGDRKSLNGFLMWHAEYAELFFFKKFWPDFNEKDVKKVLKKLRFSSKTKFGA